MLRRSFTLGLAVAALVAVGSLASARGAMIPVRNDSGSLGSFVLTNLGGGTYEIDLTPLPLPQLQRVNGAVVITDADFGPKVGFSVVGGLGGNDYDVTSDMYLPKKFEGVPRSAELTYTLTAGQAGTGLNKDGLILSGWITSVPSRYLDLGADTYDFAPLYRGRITLVLTGSDYSAGVGSMADVINGAMGDSVSGTGAFSQAIPEPTSMALLGIGLSGLIAFRRRLARRAMA